MTPGLAGSVASGDMSVTWGDGTWGDTTGGDTTCGDIVAVLLRALRREFTVIPERAQAPRRRTWLDSFDWRLHAAGLLLEYVHLPRGGELRLTAVAESGAGLAPIAVEPVMGWQASRPHLAYDLPAGPIADRVAGIIAPRALIPVATITSTVAVSRLLNEDAKTVARLIVERPALVTGTLATGTLATSTPTTGTLTPRVSIAEVRGYPGHARRAARIVAETLGTESVAGDLLHETLAALGRRPADYSNKVDADITPRMPATQAVAAILLRLLDTLEANTPGVLKDTDTEFLHDFRVAVRRTRAALKLLGDTLGPQFDTRRFAAEFKWLGDITTPTRDLDVHLLGFEDTAKSLRAAKPDDLEPFRSYLRGRRAREFRALSRVLLSLRFRELMQEWRATLTMIREGERRQAGGTGRSGKISAVTLAAERTRRAFAKVARMGSAITPDSPHESLHDLRKRCKELRYALEFFAPLHAPVTYGKVLGDLKRLQDCLGDFQDNEVQIAEIRSLATAMLAANEAPAVTLLAMGEVTAGLAAGQNAAREDFERRFAAFAGLEGQRRMSSLLRGVAE